MPRKCLFDTPLTTPQKLKRYRAKLGKKYNQYILNNYHSNRDKINARRRELYKLKQMKEEKK